MCYADTIQPSNTKADRLGGISEACRHWEVTGLQGDDLVLRGEHAHRACIRMLAARSLCMRDALDSSTPPGLPAAACMVAYICMYDLPGSSMRAQLSCCRLTESNHFVYAPSRTNLTRTVLWPCRMCRVAVGRWECMVCRGGGHIFTVSGGRTVAGATAHSRSGATVYGCIRSLSALLDWSGRGARK